MSAREHNQAIRDLQQIEHSVRRLREELQWAEEVPLSRIRPPSDATQRRSTGPSDPTGEIVTAGRNQSARKNLDRSYRAVGRAFDALCDAEAAVAALFGAAEFVAAIEDEPISVLLSKRELREVQSAKKRRQARGQDHGRG